MKKSDVCIATITWARDEAEEILLKGSLQELSAYGLPIIVTDGGSTAAFLDSVRRLPNITVFSANKKGVQAQAQESLLAAGETARPFILYTEPDKKDFFKEGLDDFLEQVITAENTGIVMASRNPQSFSTFPSFQQMTETIINNCCAEIVGRRLDYTYGPFLLNRKLLPHLCLSEEDIE